MTTRGEDETYWGRHAAVYDEGVDYVVGRGLRTAIVRKLSREKDLGHLLECGCGTGFFTKAVAPRAVSVTATDISSAMLAVAKNRLSCFGNIAFSRVDGERQPFPATSFDTVLIANVVNTVKDPARVLREAHRVLRYGGWIIVVTYTSQGMTAPALVELSLRYLERFGPPPPWGLKNYHPDELRQLVEQVGFTVRHLCVLGEGPRAIYLKARKLVKII
ncbi:MAG: class I SAM-dependent methyltransferase [Syntrophales bacterium]|nr:class I SAM-dependent methyltransferase [Syntrophales bacterium]